MMGLKFNLLFFGLLLIASVSNAQLKVGTNPSTINPNAAVEIESTNKGLLLPRLTLTATNNFSPLNAFVMGMFVYNTATSGTAPNNVTPGIYYCDGTKWVRLDAGSALTGTFWSLTGNAGTNPATNFIGTTDNIPFLIKANGQEAVRILPNSNVGIGTATPNAKLDINGNLRIEQVSSGTFNDSILVQDNVDKTVKRVSGATLLRGVQKKLIITAIAGQTEYITPATITDYNKVFLYRNGVLIDFVVSGANVITAEIAAVAGDEIRIVQIL